MRSGNSTIVADRVITEPRGDHGSLQRAPNAPPVAIAGCAVLWLVACTPTNFEVNSESTPMCDAQDSARWTHAVTQTQGVEAYDPIGFDISTFPAERFASVVNNWYPLYSYKQTLCGELHHFNVYDGSGAEMDWNQFVIPNPDFQYLIDDALPFKGGSGVWCVDDNWHDCEGRDDCMEGELTPDESFYENPWFPKSTGSSVLEGRDVCMYGAWVRECVHGHRPEIHPAELTWWKDRWRDADLYWLMALQDDSNRFDTDDDFDLDGTVPASWRPWGAAPMLGRFLLAFELNPSAGPILRYQIGEAFSRNVVTSANGQARRDADNGKSHAIEYDGKIVLTAEETQENDDDIGVLFTDLCKRPDDVLQGYVAVTTETGKNNSGEEGYHVLYVTVNEEEVGPQPVEVPDLKADAFLVTEGIPESLRPGDFEGRQQVLGDMHVSTQSSGRGEPVAIGVKEVELVTEYSQRSLPYQPDARGSAGVLRGVPLIDSAELVFTSDSGAKYQTHWPGMTIVALVGAQVPETTDAPGASWSIMAEAAGGAKPSVPSKLSLKQANTITLEAVPRYSLLRNGSPSLEEGSPFVERLNEILSDDRPADLQRIFGEAEPVDVRWSVRATSLATGSSIEVLDRGKASVAAGAGTLQIETTDSKTPDGSLQITLPTAMSDDIYEIVVTTEVEDTFGSSYSVDTTVWSHFLSDGDGAELVRKLVPVIATQTNVSPDRLSAGVGVVVDSPEDPRIRDPNFRRSQMLHNFALQAADDGQITIDELSALFRGARQLSSH